MVSNGLAAVQFEPVVGDPATNLETIDSLSAALPSAVELAVFPELCVTGYDLEEACALAEPIPGAVTDTLVEIAERTGLHVAVGLPERADGSVFNALAYVRPDGVTAVYRKQRLWGEEAERFAAGTEPVVVDTPVGRVGMLVCYDLNFPELALTYARREVDVLAVSSAWRTSFRADWRLLTRARALDGPCYVVGANHLGDQRGRDHAGHSLVVGPTGTVQGEVGGAPGPAVAPFSRPALDRARDRNPVHRQRNGPEDRH